MNTQRNDLSIARGTALRGLAILIIAYHNFVHLYPTTLNENEWSFSTENAAEMWQYLLHPTLTLPSQLISFFGHYGIVVFLFLSGYGLVKRYESGNRATVLSPVSFIAKHYRKLLVLILPALVLGIIYQALFSGWSLPVLCRRGVYQVLFIANFFPQPKQFVFVPWWFLGMILQLYVIYRLVIYSPADAKGWRRYGVPLLLTAVCWLGIRCVAPESWFNTWLHVNSVGQMLPFAVGVIVSRSEQDAMGQTDNRAKALLRNIAGLAHESHAGKDAIIMVAAAILTVFSSLSYSSWLCTPLFVVLFSNSLGRLCPKRLLKPFLWVGAISSGIYVMHPLVRAMLLRQLGSMHLALLVYLAASIALGWGYHLLQQRFKH